MASVPSKSKGSWMVELNSDLQGTNAIFSISRASWLLCCSTQARGPSITTACGRQRMRVRRVSRMTKKLRHEADEIPSIRQYLIVNRLIAGCQRGSLDLKDWRTEPYLKGVRDSFGCDHC